MKLHAQTAAGQNAITAYGADYMAVNGRVLTRSFILAPERLIEDWPPGTVDELQAEHFAAVLELACPVVLLGTGPQQRFPATALLRGLIERRIGIEVMDSFAAARTYNILMAEGRQVAAAILLPSPR